MSKKYLFSPIRVGVYWLFCIFVTGACASPFKKWNKQVDKFLHSHLDKKPDLPTPPNTVWLRDNLFIDKSEITNLNYLEFLYYLSEDSTFEYYQNHIPLGGVWTDSEVPFNDSIRIALSLGYLEYEGYRFLPVVGVSYEQAQNYCKWRSEVVSEHFMSTRNKKYRFSFRLPKEIEWEEAAQKGFEQEETNEYGFDTQLVPLASFNLKDTSNYEVPPTRYVYSEPVNLLGLHHTIGNVAEMVAERGIAKGGSWLHVPLQSQIKRRIRYTYPASWLGFRCICEVTDRF